ncbi:MAG: rRNA pseudouridine synthase [Candidatus Komeilibacteria bacterium]|nr:rRNA pseudouridine synthase [Candidatus Komeilibacteria bacterium]
MRLHKFLAGAGLASRRAAEGIISAGKVKVNGEIVRTMGFQIDPTKDDITAYGKKVTLPEGKIYLIMNKPVGYITTKSDPQGRPTVFSLLPKCYQTLFPVGRLDRDSEGLLLFTNDGELAQRLLHPRYQHEKEYMVQVDGAVTTTLAKTLLIGVKLSEGLARADKVVVHKPDTLRIVIHQGWKRQIRRMLKSLGYDTLMLKRVRLGRLQLPVRLQPGEVKEVKKGDIIV